MRLRERGKFKTVKLNTGFLTERGYKVFLILAGCAGFALFFVDLFLAILAVALAGFIFYDYKKAKSAADKIDEFVRINPKGVKEHLVAGEKKKVKFSCEVKKDMEVILQPSLKQVRIRPSRLKKGKHTLEFLLSSDICGHYKMDKIGTEVSGPRKLIGRKTCISFDLELEVFPRVMVALIRAALYLLRGGEGGVGEIPLPFKGGGTEYADTREYLPGDSLHHIDWKATARHAKLMVKEFFLEGGQGAHIVYDIRATGPVSQDKLATSFLNTCLGAAEQGYPAGVTIHDGEKILLHSTEKSPHHILKMAMGYVLESMKVELEDIDVLVDPLTSSQIRRFLSRVKEERVKRVLEFEARVIQDGLGEPCKFLAEFSRQIGERKQFLLISELSGEPVEILQLVDEIKSCHLLTVIQPAEPWREAESLEKAYRWYERMRKIEELLAQHRVQVVRRPVA